MSYSCFEWKRTVARAGWSLSTIDQTKWNASSESSLQTNQAHTATVTIIFNKWLKMCFKQLTFWKLHFKQWMRSHYSDIAIWLSCWNGEQINFYLLTSFIQKWLAVNKKNAFFFSRYFLNGFQSFFSVVTISLTDDGCISRALKSKSQRPRFTMVKYSKIRERIVIVARESNNSNQCVSGDYKQRKTLWIGTCFSGTGHSLKAPCTSHSESNGTTHKKES